MKAKVMPDYFQHSSKKALDSQTFIPVNKQQFKLLVLHSHEEQLLVQSLIN